MFVLAFFGGGESLLVLVLGGVVWGLPTIVSWSLRSGVLGDGSCPSSGNRLISRSNF